jgi:hypothetical protein
MKNISLTVYNILGQTIFSTKENNLGNSFATTIDFSNNPTGIYILDVNIDGIRTIKKIIRELNDTY